MVEEIKQENHQPKTSGDNGIIRDEKGRIMSGSAPLNPDGRPLESISITTEQKKFFRENPEEFAKYCESIRKDPSMKKIVWNYLDGMPKESISHLVKVEEVLSEDQINELLNRRAKENNSSGEVQPD